MLPLLKEYTIDEQWQLYQTLRQAEERLSVRIEDKMARAEAGLAVINCKALERWEREKAQIEQSNRKLLEEWTQENALFEKQLADWEAKKAAVQEEYERQLRAWEREREAIANRNKERLELWEARKEKVSQEWESLYQACRRRVSTYTNRAIVATIVGTVLLCPLCCCLPRIGLEVLIGLSEATAILLTLLLTVVGLFSIPILIIIPWVLVSIEQRRQKTLEARWKELIPPKPALEETPPRPPIPKIPSKPVGPPPKPMLAMIPPRPEISIATLGLTPPSPSMIGEWKNLMLEKIYPRWRSLLSDEYGLIGEVQFTRFLDKMLDDEFMILCRICVEEGRDIDHIVLGPTGIWVFETKFWGGIVVWREEVKEWEHWKWDPHTNEYQPDPYGKEAGKQWKWNVEAVKRHIKKHLQGLPRNVPVQGAVIFTHPSTRYINIDAACDIPYVVIRGMELECATPGALPNEGHTIEEFDREKRLQVAQSLLERHWKIHGQPLPTGDLQAQAKRLQETAEARIHTWEKLLSLLESISNASGDANVT